MSTTTSPTESGPERGFLAPQPESKPVDHCFRCGVETPPGVGLCDQHNRGHISGPSATQMHATIFGGIVVGVIALFILAGLAVTSNGPFASTVTSAVAGADGLVTLAFTLTNEGADEGHADCRVTRDGVPRPDDLTFRTEPVAAGQTVALERVLQAPPAGSASYRPEAITVVCT